MTRTGRARHTTYDMSFPDQAPGHRTNYYDFPSLQWRNFRTIRMKPGALSLVFLSLHYLGLLYRVFDDSFSYV